MDFFSLFSTAEEIRCLICHLVAFIFKGWSKKLKRYEVVGILAEGRGKQSLLPNSLKILHWVTVRALTTSPSLQICVRFAGTQKLILG